MGAESVTGVGQGASHGKVKPGNSCGGCGCGCKGKDCGPPPPPRPVACSTLYVTGNQTVYRSGGGTCIKVCSN